MSEVSLQDLIEELRTWENHERLVRKLLRENPPKSTKDHLDRAIEQVRRARQKITDHRAGKGKKYKDDHDKQRRRYKKLTKR